MANFATILSDFHILHPTYQRDQGSSIDWLAAAHTFAQNGLENRESRYQKMRKMIARFGCDPSRIQNRNSALEDFTHTEWNRMRIFNLEKYPEGQNSQERSRFFSEVVSAIFSNFYSETTSPPEAIIHVTCTGYVSPSGAQRLVSERNWGNTTEVLHAYHMGCYAALPANRIARGLLSRGDRNKKADGKVDIVHTELCSLHMNPTLSSPEQLVVQSLFADGFIKYSVSKTAPTGLEILALKEAIVPHTETAMAWEVGNFGMLMSLSREVPDLIAASLPSFFQELCSQVDISPDFARANALFAIHPGGPKIIDRIQSTLELSNIQVQASRDILKNYGNMSSATLPHIWKQILDDPSIEEGRLLFSFAFGPGLTISSGIFRKLGRG